MMNLQYEVRICHKIHNKGTVHWVTLQWVHDKYKLLSFLSGTDVISEKLILLLFMNYFASCMPSDVANFLQICSNLQKHWNNAIWNDGSSIQIVSWRLSCNLSERILQERPNQCLKFWMLQITNSSDLSRFFFTIFFSLRSWKRKLTTFLSDVWFGHDAVYFNMDYQ